MKSGPVLPTLPPVQVRTCRPIAAVTPPPPNSTTPATMLRSIGHFHIYAHPGAVGRNGYRGNLSSARASKRSSPPPPKACTARWRLLGIAPTAVSRPPVVASGVDCFSLPSVPPLHQPTACFLPFVHHNYNGLHWQQVATIAMARPKSGT
jgi:hypothetical protein